MENETPNILLIFLYFTFYIIIQFVILYGSWPKSLLLLLFLSCPHHHIAVTRHLTLVGVTHNVDACKNSPHLDLDVVVVVIVFRRRAERGGGAADPRHAPRTPAARPAPGGGGGGGRGVGGAVEPAPRTQLLQTLAVEGEVFVVARRVGGVCRPVGRGGDWGRQNEQVTPRRQHSEPYSRRTVSFVNNAQYVKKYQIIFYFILHRWLETTDCVTLNSYIVLKPGTEKLIIWQKAAAANGKTRKSYSSKLREAVAETGIDLYFNAS